MIVPGEKLYIFRRTPSFGYVKSVVTTENCSQNFISKASITFLDCRIWTGWDLANYGIKRLVLAFCFISTLYCVEFYWLMANMTVQPSFQVYYPVRHHLVQHMVSAMQRLGFTPSVTIEQRKLAVDLAEVVIKWELQRIKDQQVGSLNKLVKIEMLHR